jgi:hypothetical protein
VGRTMGQRDSVIRALQQFERYAAAALHIG